MDQYARRKQNGEARSVFDSCRKSIDVAKGFVDKLVAPSIEELGLLVKDQISLWRFKNQIGILTRAKAICEKNNISVKAIPPKLLCPYLEYASLEDDPDLQETWATLLVNMVDSEQNIQNHVFPYILSQLSKDEFLLLESVFIEKRGRVAKLHAELADFVINRPKIEEELQMQLAAQKQQQDAANNEGRRFTPEYYQIHQAAHETEAKLRSLKWHEYSLKWKMSAPQNIPEQGIKEFELANIIRLGMAKVVYEASAGKQSIEIPRGDPERHRSVDFDIDIETQTNTIFTELGELFIEACRVKQSAGDKQ